MMQTEPLLGKLLDKPVVTYVLTALLAIVLAAFILNIWVGDLRIPFGYTGGNDATFYFMLIKTIADHGWTFTNPNLAAPGQMQLYDWPIPDNLPLAIIKLITLFTGDAGLVLNLYYLLTFPLTALASLWTLRTLGASRPTAVLVSMLYTFAPGHLGRGQGHLLLATDFSIPLLIAVAFWAGRGELKWPATSKELLGSRFLQAALIIVIAGSCSIYYAFFGTYLILVGAAIASFRKGSFKTLLVPSLLSVLMLFTVVANMLPNLMYIMEHGESELVVRPAGQAEKYGLKITQMLMPIAYHRVEAFRGIRNHYDENTLKILRNENGASALGTLSSIGFLLLLLHLFGLRMPFKDDDDVQLLSRLNIAAILLATVGGFGSMIAIFVTSKLRGYNRISLFIAFLTLLLFAGMIDAFIRRVRQQKWKTDLAWLAVLLLAGLALADQLRPRPGAPAAQKRSEIYAKDAAFAQKLESLLPEGAMIFQLPYISFPGQHPKSMKSYDHFKMYFHTDRLRWSYGAIVGREIDTWQHDVATSKIVVLVAKLRAAGFAGIYVDCWGYGDGGQRLNAALRRALGTRPVTVPEDRRRMFFFLDDSLDKRPEERPSTDNDS